MKELVFISSVQKELADEFEQRGGQFVVTLWRDWLTAEVIAGLDLNDRQAAVLPLLRTQRTITSAEYQQITSAPRRTATHDLKSLVAKGLLVLSGEGRGARYTLAKSPARNAPEMRQMRQPNAGAPRTNQSAANAPETRQMRDGPTTRQKPDKRDTTAARPKRVKHSAPKKTAKTGRRKKK